jgi:hypothetical protein
MIVPKFSVVNAPEWDKAFVKWVGVANLSIRDAMRTQGRLLFERLINWRGGAIATPPQGQAQGKRAVQRDIYRAVFPLRADGFNDPKLRKHVRQVVTEGNHVALQEMVRGGVFGQNVSKAFVAEFDPEMHKSQRKSRGRVPRTSAKSYRYATDDVAKLKEYIVKRQAMVGQAKGGWAKALRRLLGKPAAWYDKHAKAGTYEDRLSNASKPEFVGINRSAWASGGDQDRIMGMALEGRAMAMTKDIERMLENEWKKRR